MCWSGGGPPPIDWPFDTRTGSKRVTPPQSVKGTTGTTHSLNASHSRRGSAIGYFASTRNIAPKSFVSATLAAEGKLSRHQLKELTTSVMANPDKRALILSMADGASHCHHTETESK